MVENCFIFEQGFDIGLKSMKNAEQRLNNSTKVFRFGQGIIVPDRIVKDNIIINPMIYINERVFGIPNKEFVAIPELLVYDDQDLITWLSVNANLAVYAQEPSNLWIFPGSGGEYMKRMLEIQGVKPKNTINVKAKRSWGTNGEVWCNVDLPLGKRKIQKQLDTTERAIFVDDAICTGSTVSEIIESIDLDYFWQPKEIIIATQTLATPRKKERLAWLLQQMGTQLQIYAALFYGGETLRPRLLSTGSLVRGLKDPSRFSAKKYPEDLTEKVKRIMQIS